MKDDQTFDERAEQLRKRHEGPLKSLIKSTARIAAYFDEVRRGMVRRGSIPPPPPEDLEIEGRSPPRRKESDKVEP